MGALDAARFALRTVIGLGADPSPKERTEAVNAARNEAGTKISSPIAAERAQSLMIQKEELDRLLAKRREALKAQLAEAEADHAAAVTAAEESAEEARQKLDTAIADDIKGRLRPAVAKWAENGNRSDLRAIAETWTELDTRAREQIDEPVNPVHLALALAAVCAEPLPARVASFVASHVVSMYILDPAERAAAQMAGALPALLEPVLKRLEAAVLEYADAYGDPDALAVFEAHTGRHYQAIQTMKNARDLAQREEYARTAPPPLKNAVWKPGVGFVDGDALP